MRHYVKRVYKDGGRHHLSTCHIGFQIVQPYPKGSRQALFRSDGFQCAQQRAQVNTVYETRHVMSPSGFISTSVKLPLVRGL
jgi:hypothetical protein